MDKKTRNIGLITLAAGALTYPAWLLYKYIAKRNADKSIALEDEHPHKAFAPNYRHKNKNRNRTHVESNGHLTGGLA